MPKVTLSEAVTCAIQLAVFIAGLVGNYSNYCNQGQRAGRSLEAAAWCKTPSRFYMTILIRQHLQLQEAFF
jgi:hypothetical protein